MKRKTKTVVTRTGGAKFSRDADASTPMEFSGALGTRFIYFLASSRATMPLAAPLHENLLIAINELSSSSDLLEFKAALTTNNVFIDSGIFHLTMEHARRHAVSMDAALSLAPDEIDGFDDLLEKYVELIRTHGESSWGYIELDQGGRENKIRTRARLEKLGLRPIPVYHPLNDGWDYFDYLAQRYDRICFGNVVQANQETRLRLIATAWERHRQYPNLWIHLLGFTPNEWLNALPINSGDSSTWLYNIIWGDAKERSDGKVVGEIPNSMYLTGTVADSERGRDKATRFSAYTARMQERNWRNHWKGLRELGFEMYPKVTR